MIAWRSHGADYSNKSPLSRMNRVNLVEPQEGEPFACTTEELHKALVERGIRNLIYSGFATDMCVLRAPGGVEPMAARDYSMFLLRDATVGVECPDTFEERLATRWAIRYFETHFGDTITTKDFVDACSSS
jgi:nicotinamidase-related amidase